MSSIQINDAQIAEAAFFLWKEEGQPHGRDQEFWYRARAELESAPAGSVTPTKPKRRAAPRKKAEAAVIPQAKKPARAAAAKAETAKTTSAKPRAPRAKKA